MYTVRWLNPVELAEYDYTGEIRRKVENWPKVASFAPVSQFYDCSPEDGMNFIRVHDDRLENTKHQAYIAYDRETYSKYGRQGGTVPLADLKQVLLPYYERAEFHPTMHPALLAGRDFLISWIKDLIRKYGYPQLRPSCIRGTYSGCPLGGKKGSFDAETLLGNSAHALPAVPGVRIMRNSIRAIFMIPNQAIHMMGPVLNGMKDFLVTYLPQLFDGWRNPAITMHTRIQNAVDRGWASLELDYIKMDQGFILWVFHNVILPIYEVAFPQNYISFAYAVEEAFSRPLFFGDALWEGTHSLFSGEPFTNDFETIYTVVKVIGALLISHKFYSPFTLVANGDDMTLLVKSLRTADKVYHICSDIAASTGMFIHELGDKTRLVQHDSRFCRHVYYVGGIRNPNPGTYPAILAMNNILQPERPQSNPGIAAVADLARLDGCANVPYFTEMLQYLRSHSTHKFVISEDDVDNYNNISDWWARLYGTKWSPDSSIAWNTMQHLS
nr:MAG: RNA-dependent RNA polymerase [Porcine picobirnavirus]